MKEEKKKNYFKKETVIAAVIGFLIGVAVLFLIGWSLDYFATSAGIAKLKYGEETIATVNGQAISTQTIYDHAKKTEGLNIVINEVDKILLENKYQLTEKEENGAKEEADYYIDYYTEMGYSEEEFLSGNGFANYDEFLADIKANIKYTKYIYDYLESKLEDGAVEKYYNENKELIETYDTEHVLVKITDDVKDKDALALANEIISKLNEGKTFDEITQEYGDNCT